MIYGILNGKISMIMITFIIMPNVFNVNVKRMVIKDFMLIVMNLSQHIELDQIHVHLLRQQHYNVILEKQMKEWN